MLCYHALELLFGTLLYDVNPYSKPSLLGFIFPAGRVSFSVIESIAIKGDNISGLHYTNERNSLGIRLKTRNLKTTEQLYSAEVESLMAFLQ